MAEKGEDVGPTLGGRHKGEVGMNYHAYERGALADDHQRVDAAADHRGAYEAEDRGTSLGHKGLSQNGYHSDNLWESQDEEGEGTCRACDSQVVHSGGMAYQRGHKVVDIETNVGEGRVTLRDEGDVGAKNQTQHLMPEVGHPRSDGLSHRQSLD